MGRPAYGYRNKDDKKIPGVTSILKYAALMDTDILCSWAAKLARQGKDWRKERDEAGKHGSMLHDLCETRLPSYLADPADRPEGATDEAWEKLKLSYAAIRKWWVDTAPVPLLNEAPLVSERLQVGGTIDRLVNIRGKGNFLLDFKTGSQVGAKEVAQMAAYRELLDECGHPRPDGAILLHAPTKTPGYVRPVWLYSDTLDRGLVVFESALAIANAAKELATVCE